MTVAALHHDPDAALPSLGYVINLAPGPASQAVAMRLSEVRQHFAEVLLSQSSYWMMIFEQEFPTLAHDLSDPDLPLFVVDHLTRSEIASVASLAGASGVPMVRMPPPPD